MYVKLHTEEMWGKVYVSHAKPSQVGEIYWRKERDGFLLSSLISLVKDKREKLDYNTGWMLKEFWEV